MLSSSTPEPPDLGDEAEAKAASYLRMRAKGIRDVAVLRAFELVPRHLFVPKAYRALAARDVALPTGCGQTMLEPWLVATAIEALAVAPWHRLLEIGSGSGFATAILAQLAGEVIGLERYRSLAGAAAERLAAMEIANAVVEWGDGLAPAPDLGSFDRIIVHGLLSGSADLLTDRLRPDGVLVCARAGDAGQVLACLRKTPDGSQVAASAPCRMQPLVAGLAAML